MITELQKLPIIIGSGGGSDPPPPPAPYVPVEDLNTLQSKAIYRIVDILGEGEIEGLVDGHKSIFLDGTPLQAEDDSYNFEGVTIETRNGLPDQEAISGFPDGTTTPVGVNVQLTQDGGTVTRQFVDATADAVYVLASVPALYTQQDNGDLVGGSIEFTIQINSETAITKTITGKCMSTYQANYRIELPTGTDTFDVKLTRITADSEDSQVQNNLWWTSYTKIIDHKITYMDTALVGAEVDASLFGSTVPKRSYLVRGIKVQVPSGYTPPYKDAAGIWQPAVYPETWDGTMQSPVYTPSPPWCFYDMHCSGRYGAGLDDAGGMPKYDLYQISKYCDELIDDGTGTSTLEPRFTLNCVINKPQEAYALFNTLVAVFRGMAYWGSGSMAVSQDAPTDLATGESDPQLLVTPSNVVDGLFVYEGSSLKARHTVAFVTWNDPNNHFEPTIEVVENRASINLYGYRPIELAPLGLTSRGQAHRIGKWLLDSEENETELVKYTAGMDHAFIAPGMLVAIADPFYANSTRFGGRLAAVSEDGLTITLDSAVLLSSGETYELTCVLPGDTDTLLETEDGFVLIFEDGDIVELNVTDFDDFYTADGTPNIETKTVTTTPDDAEHLDLIINEAFTINPAPGAVWILVASNLEPRLFRVLTNLENEGHHEITALFNDPTKYARVESDILLDVPDYFLYDSTGPILTPTNPSLQLLNYYADGFLKKMLIFSWEHPGDERIKEFHAQWKMGDDNWQDFAPIPTFSVEKRDVQIGTYNFRVQSVSASGATSEWAEDDLVVADDSMPDVTGLQLVDGASSTVFTGRDAKFKWDQVSDSDIPVIGGVDPWFVSYKVEIFKGTTLVRTDYPVVPEYTYTHEMNEADAGVTRTFTIKVYQVGNLGQLSATSADLAVANVAPTMAGYTPSVTAAPYALQIDWSSWSTSDADFTAFKIYVDENADPTTLVATIGPESEGWYVPVLDNEVLYYAKIVPVDAFGDGTASEVGSGTPIDLGIVLPNSITMIDSDSNTPEDLAKLYDRNLTSDGISYTLAGTDKFIQYELGLIDYIDRVIINTADANADVYIAYSQDGDTWDYLKAEADHTLTTLGELLAATDLADAQANYWSLETGENVATFPARAVAKYCRLFFTGTFTSVIYELVFIREVIAEQITTDSLSALSANLGEVITGKIQSQNYSPGTSGMLIDVENETAEFNSITLKVEGTNGDIILDGDDGSIKVAGPDGGTATDYAILENGDILFYHYFASSHHLYKTLKKREYGQAEDGDTVTIPGYWKSQPSVILSPASLQTYNGTYSAQDQEQQIGASTVTETSPGSGVWEFDVSAKLVLSSGVYTRTLGWSCSLGTWSSESSPIYNTIANCTSLRVTGGVWTSGVSCTMKLYIDGSLKQTWSCSVFQTSISFDETFTLTAGIHPYYFVCATGTTTGGGSANFGYETASGATIPATGTCQWLAIGD